MNPELSICITSCNRLKYLKALISSLGDLFEDDRVEICVVDMRSTEIGMSEYLEHLESRGAKVYYFNPKEPRNWINDEYIGRNKLLDMASGKYLMFLQDDGQFIADSETLWSHIEDFSSMENVYCLEIYAVRKSSMRNVLNLIPEIINEKKYWVRKDRHFLTTGIYKREVYNKIGYYRINWPMKKEYWGRSEVFYSHQFKKIFPKGQVYRLHVPLMASIWNDPRGGYAFIRESKRFGHYIDPKGDLYYQKNVTIQKIKELNQKNVGPLSFTEIAKPIGWDIKKNKDGEIEKYSQWKIMFKDGPSEELPPA